MSDPETGMPSLEAFRSALSERTAAIFITNPEDTGIFNPQIKEIVDRCPQKQAPSAPMTSQCKRHHDHYPCKGNRS